MKISGLGNVSSSSGIGRKRPVSAGGAFAQLLDAAAAGDISPALAASDVAATAAIHNLLALQEISEKDVRRQKLLQQGNHLLDTLEDLRRRLLTGILPYTVIQNIARQLSIQKQMVDDPALTALMEDIELRAAVELAKLEQALERRQE